MLCSRLHCRACDHVSYNFENFMDLSIPIPHELVSSTDHIDLIDCLRAYTAVEKIEK